MFKILTYTDFTFLFHVIVKVAGIDDRDPKASTVLVPFVSEQ